MPTRSWWSSLVRCAHGLPVCERLDDEHRRAAVNAHEGRQDWLSIRTPGLLDLPARLLRHKQLARLLDALPPMGIGQQPVVPDPVESARQHVQQEAAHELLGRECHRLVALATLVTVVLPAERHPAFVVCHQPRVGDRHPVRVAREVGQHSLWPRKRLLVSMVYAVEGGCFVLGPCAVMSKAMVDELCDTPDKHQLVHVGGGHAVIYGPDGRPLVEKLPEDAEGLLIAELDLGLIGVAKNAMDTVGHYSRPDVHTLLLNKKPGKRVEHMALPLDAVDPNAEATPSAP